MKLPRKERHTYRELKLINHNLSLIIQNQNELYVKLEQLFRAANSSGFFGDANHDEKHRS